MQTECPSAEGSINLDLVADVSKLYKHTRLWVAASPIEHWPRSGAPIVWPSALHERTCLYLPVPTARRGEVLWRVFVPPPINLGVLITIFFFFSALPLFITIIPSGMPCYDVFTCVSIQISCGHGNLETCRLTRCERGDEEMDSANAVLRLVALPRIAASVLVGVSRMGMDGWMDGWMNGKWMNDIM